MIKPWVARVLADDAQDVDKLGHHDVHIGSHVLSADNDDTHDGCEELHGIIKKRMRCEFAKGCMNLMSNLLTLHQVIVLCEFLWRSTTFD